MRLRACASPCEPLRAFANLREPFPPFASLCEPLPRFASLCKPLRAFASLGARRRWPSWRSRSPTCARRSSGARGTAPRRTPPARRRATSPPPDGPSARKAVYARPRPECARCAASAVILGRPGTPARCLAGERQRAAAEGRAAYASNAGGLWEHTALAWALVGAVLDNDSALL